MRALLVVLAAALGCAHAPLSTRTSARSPAADPEPALVAWREAIAKNDAHAAYQVLSSSLRARVSENDFALQWKAAHADLAAQEDALHAPYGVRHATGELADGRAWPLVREPDRWRVAAVHPLSPGGDTPEDVVRRLVAAVEARDFDALVGLLAEPLRETLEQALTERVARLKNSLHHGPIDAAGNTARIRYDPRYHLDLIQENGRWRVADFN
jgi:hypothetical protein